MSRLRLSISLCIALICAIFIPLLSQSDLQAEVNTAAIGESPQALIRETIDKIIKVNNDLAGEDKNVQRRAALREIINPHFFFAEMAKRSLGTFWDECTEAERSEFVTVFSDLLARTYLGRIDKVRDQIIDYKGERIEMPKAIVKTMVNYEGDKFPIDYKLLNENGKWGVYDVVIENIGLVANYRNEFAGIIRKEKFSGLMEMLRKKQVS